MATDSAELTFVRCRSCGALVPATATKCRICNAALDGAGKLDESADSRGASRVRQRTMSAPGGDLMDAVHKLRDEDAIETPEDSMDATSQPSDADPLEASDDDPLGAYLEEVDEGATNDAGVSALDSSQDDDDDVGFDDPLGLDESESKPFAPGMDSSRESSSGRPFAMGSGDESRDDSPLVKKPVSPFVRPGGEDPRRAGRSDRSSERGSRERREDRQPKSDRGGRMNRPEDARGPARSVETAQSVRAPAPVKPPTVQSSAARGRLCGWLVSYSDTDGTAIELREGKYFVTGSSFKGTDLVVDDESVSTPHALLSVSIDNGIRVQDLMSENGLYCKNNGASDFQRTEGPVTLRHGDWVKFGSVEFLVCTVARPEGK